MPKVIKRIVYGESKWKCAKCGAIHWFLAPKCQRCGHKILERIK